VGCDGTRDQPIGNAAAYSRLAQARRLGLHECSGHLQPASAPDGTALGAAAARASMVLLSADHHRAAGKIGVRYGLVSAQPCMVFAGQRSEPLAAVSRQRTEDCQLACQNYAARKVSGEISNGRNECGGTKRVGFARYTLLALLEREWMGPHYWVIFDNIDYCHKVTGQEI
jgi:hypothetical protein